MFANKNILIIVFILLVNAFAFAQPGGGGLEGGEVEVIKDFDARLQDTEKLKVLPGLPPVTTTPRKLNYNIPTRTVPVEYPAPKLRPLALRRGKVDKGFKGFLKAGYGLPASPYLELGYNLLDKDGKYNIGLHGLYHGANFSDDEIDFQRFSEMDITLKGTYYLEEGGMAIGAKLNNKIDEVHYFGYDNSLSFSGDTLLTREQVKQRFSTFSGGLNLFNGERNDFDVSYNAGINFYSMKDNYASSETGFDLLLSGTKWFNEKHPLNLTIKSDFTTYEDTVKQKLNNVYLQPNFTYHSDAFRLKVGANIISHNDEFTFLPDLEATVAVLGSRLAIFGGWKGDFVKNNMKRLSDYNPFIATYQKIQLENTEYNHFYGGVKGNLGIIEYNGQLGFKDVKNLAVFESDQTDLRRRFLVEYDTAKIFNIEGVVTARLFKGFELTGAITQNVYSDLALNEKAWHLPATELNVTATYVTLEDKLRLKGELYIENGVPFLNDEGVADNLNGLFDLSVGADYQITKNFGAFLNLNNIASNKRQRWYRYPTYGLNVLGGIKLRF